jgi:hypothetical protein
LANERHWVELPVSEVSAAVLGSRGIRFGGLGGLMAASVSAVTNQKNS